MTRQSYQSNGLTLIYSTAFFSEVIGENAYVFMDS